MYAFILNQQLQSCFFIFGDWEVIIFGILSRLSLQLIELMEADNDDLVTDFNQTVEQKSQSRGKDQKGNEWDESKFEKQLNIQIKKPQQRKYEEETEQKQLLMPQYHCKQRLINDKNIQITPTQQAFRNEDEENEQHQKRQSLSKNEQNEIGIQNSNKPNEQTKVISDSLQNLKLTQQNYLQDNQPPNHKNQPKQYKTEPEKITKFSQSFKSQTITVNESLDEAQQSKYYFQNCKIILTQPITSINSSITFRLDNLKYCIGVGVALQQVLQKHQYDYKSTTHTEMGHGLYIVTTQGYSWSHSQNQDDDAFREHFNNLYSGVNINVKLQGENLSFKAKKGSFSMILPSHIRQKYTLCFCTYLHEKTDAISIVPQ